MTKARNIADLLDANGDVKTASLDNVPASNDASALTTGTLNNARLPSNISDGGTEGTKIATGTTAQRGSTTGQIRFNSTTGLAEYYTGTAFKSIDSPPTVSSIDVTEVASDGGGNQTIVITGSGFGSGAIVTFVGNAGTNFNASTVTVDSTTQITAVAPKASFLNAQEPYGVKVQNTSGLSATLASQINVDSSPSWSTASGSLGSFFDSTRSGISVSATATDSDGDTIVYSVQSGSLPSGLSLNTSSGAITGTANAVGSDTTSSFTLRATANSKTADRAFTITINAPVSTTYSYTGSNQTFTVPTGVNSFVVDIKGAGGGSQGGAGAGGTSGRTQGTRTASAGQSYIVIVGEKGKLTSGTSFGGGGGYNQGNGNGGGGGGLSGIFLTSYTHGNSVAIAGGGGGGAYGGNSGGHGGGSSGNGGSHGSVGGSQSSGGSGQGGGSSGSALQGGATSGNGNGGAGGGGYYGGGGGAEGGTDTSGAGGSGYIGGLESGATTTTGAGVSANNNGSVVISY